METSRAEIEEVLADDFDDGDTIVEYVPAPKPKPRKRKRGGK
jgi:hypothetical protein